MPIYRVWVTTHIERPLYVDAEDHRAAECATWEYLSDFAGFWPTLPAPWEYADAEDYIDAYTSRHHEGMAPGDIKALVDQSGEVSYTIVGEDVVDER
jgi:hypothetical protein